MAIDRAAPIPRGTDVSTAKVRNIGASVRARLLDLARSSGDEFNLVLTRYGEQLAPWALRLSPASTKSDWAGMVLNTTP